MYLKKRTTTVVTDTRKQHTKVFYLATTTQEVLYILIPSIVTLQTLPHLQEMVNNVNPLPSMYGLICMYVCMYVCM